MVSVPGARFSGARSRTSPVAACAGASRFSVTAMDPAIAIGTVPSIRRLVLSLRDMVDPLMSDKAVAHGDTL